jgi:D-glycero-alpha-D-manno-heptose-7-phosphate kinase
MGSSSSFTVGMLNSARLFRGLTSTSEWLAQEAIRIEQDVIGEHVGSQDQVWAAYGGLTVIVFNSDGTFRVSPLS